MSDISSFAEWEAQQLDTEENILTDGQRKLIDMANKYRIWVDRDSSNHYRSSASEDDGDGGVNLPPNLEKTVNRETMGTARIGLGTSLGRYRDWEMPRSTSDEPQSLSQRLAKEAEDEDYVSWAGSCYALMEVMAANLDFCSIHLQASHDLRARA